jgi:aryl-phospho-beta-D-glucosidase BglC (GH1 family)
MIKRYLYVSTLTLLFVCIFATVVLADTRYRGITAGNNLSDQDLQELKNWPVNVLRYALAWHEPADTASESEYFTWLSEQLDRLDQVLAISETGQYKVVIQLFTPPGGFIRTGDVAWHRIFAEKWAQEAYLKAWKIIANRYGSDSRVAAFHLLNEPAQKKVASGVLPWSQLATKTINLIRGIDRSTPIIVDSVYGNPNKINGLASVRGKNIIYGFNLYLPYGFVKQGLPGFKASVKYPTPSSNKQVIMDRLKSVYRFQNKLRGAKLWVGEFSVTRWTNERAATRYLKDVISIFEKNRWSWTYHTYREADVWDLELGSDKEDLSRTMRPSKRLGVLLNAWAKNS